MIEKNEKGLYKTYAILFYIILFVSISKNIMYGFWLLPENFEIENTLKFTFYFVSLFKYFTG